jgi:hypothetical protein
VSNKEFVLHDLLTIRIRGELMGLVRWAWLVAFGPSAYIEVSLHITGLAAEALPTTLTLVAIISTKVVSFPSEAVVN